VTGSAASTAGHSLLDELFVDGFGITPLSRQNLLVGVAGPVEPTPRGHQEDAVGILRHKTDGLGGGQGGRRLKGDQNLSCWTTCTRQSFDR
jgi:hypothetical protein